MTVNSKLFVENTARCLVDDPDAVRVEETHDEMGILLTLYVAPADMGKVIGRAGANSIAIRTLLRAIGFKENARVSLRVFDPRGPKQVDNHYQPRDKELLH